MSNQIETEVAKEIAKELTPLLYNDIKSWIGGLGDRVKKVIKKSATKKYDSIQDLLNSINNNEIEVGEKIIVNVIPAPFGPFLRRHFLVPIVGHHTKLRKGPPLVSSNPVMGMMAQATSHLMPVGLYPPVSDDVHQACLYPNDTTACGFIGLMPGVNQIVPYLFALIPSRFTPYYGSPCRVEGTLRYIDTTTLLESGFSVEEHEELRQVGKVWFLDFTGDRAVIEPINDIHPEGLWGGLYASGHLEITGGELKLKSYVDAVIDAISNEGFDIRVSQNRARQQEIALFAEGIRATLGSKFPIFSLHMDAELTRDLKTYREVFDKVTQGILGNLKEACSNESVQLANDFDLDFSYTNSTNAYSVLKSAGANNIKDPLAIAIRDWHRLRGS